MPLRMADQRPHQAPGEFKFRRLDIGTSGRLCCQVGHVAIYRHPGVAHRMSEDGRRHRPGAVALRTVPNGGSWQPFHTDAVAKQSDTGPGTALGESEVASYGRRDHVPLVNR